MELDELNRHITKEYINKTKKELLEKILKYPAKTVIETYYNLTGRVLLDSANIFCLALMLNILNYRQRMMDKPSKEAEKP